MDSSPRVRRRRSEAPFYRRLTGRQNLAVLAPEALGQPSTYVDDHLLRQRFAHHSRGQGMRLAPTAALHRGAELVVLEQAHRVGHVLVHLELVTSQERRTPRTLPSWWRSALGGCRCAEARRARPSAPPGPRGIRGRPAVL
jgi:hypothetical protein